MTSQRARAYARVTKTLRELGPAKLLPSEQARIRVAADILIFSADPLAADARAAQLDIAALCGHLTASERWRPERAGLLLHDVWGCGPSVPSALAAA